MAKARSKPQQRRDITVQDLARINTRLERLEKAVVSLLRQAGRNA